MEERLLRRRDVERQTGLCTSGLYERIRQGIFPRPIKIGKQAVAWPQSRITAWIEEQIAASENDTAVP